MSFYSDVTPGDPFEPSAQEENDIRRMLNAGGLTGVRGSSSGTFVENICINAYNPGNTVISSGVVVVFIDTLMIEGAIQVSIMPSNSDSQEWAIAQGEIPPHGFGTVLVMGAVLVPIVSGENEGEDNYSFVVPVGGGASFMRAKNGFARILRLVGSSALILVGSSLGGNYSAGNGINGDLIKGGTISLNLIGDGDISVTPVSGSTNGMMQVSYSGGPGGTEFVVPPYAALGVSGTAPDLGLGHTFIHAVKAGDVGYYDDGGMAVAQWSNKLGTSSMALTAGTPITTIDDGFIRISVVDNWKQPGKCLGLISGNDNMPLYKYGGGLFVAGPGIHTELLAGGTIGTNFDFGPGILITEVKGSTTNRLKFSANIQGGTDIDISGGTNGDPLVISYTGSSSGGSMGFPDYLHWVWGIQETDAVHQFPYTQQYSYPVYLIGYIMLDLSFMQALMLDIGSGNTLRTIPLALSDPFASLDDSVFVSNSINIMIPENTPFRIYLPDDGNGVPYGEPHRYSLFAYRTIQA